MVPKLPTHQRDYLVGIAETVGRAVQRYEASALSHVVQQGPLLRWVDAIYVRVNKQRVIATEVGRIQVLHFVRVHELDTSPRHDGLKLCEAIPGTMVSVVTQKENLKVLSHQVLGGQHCDQQE